MRRAPLVILILWFVLCVSYEFWRVASFMAEPPSGDLYAHTWGFQLLNFVVFRLGFWVVALLFILVAEGFWRARSRATGLATPSGGRPSRSRC